MSGEEITLKQIKERIKENLAKAKSMSIGTQRNSLDNDISKLMTQLRIENAQVNRAWDVNPEFLITSHRRFIGKFIVLGKKFVRKFLRWYVGPAFLKQRNFNISATKNINSINDLLIKIMDERKELMNKFNELEFYKHDMIIKNQLIDNLNFEKDKLNVQILELVKKNETLSHKVNLQNEQIIEILNHIEAIKIKINSDSNSLSLVDKKIEQLDSMVGFTNERLRRLKKQTNKNNITYIEMKDSARSVPEDNVSGNQLDYLLFEQKYRGSRETIIKRQEVYLPYFKHSKKVLDIGCGRGEFIELLLQQGIQAQGIDLNQEMVEYCQERGFDVSYSDANQYLSKMDGPVYDAIFMSQVIEHLSFKEYYSLLEQIHKCLLPGGFVVIETINVQSVFAMSNWFYMDPTHDKPVHPETLKFVIESIGFDRIEKKLLSPVSEMQVPKLQVEGEEVDNFNRYFENLSNFIYGYQDYAIIAYK
ncbi:methyltransferase domain-containing protein [Paenibacillus sp. USDA918EY]|uniref:methyltransferase domain-containing protein n=1 Tax=Paenibacillus sp. USDA918EY TaxID=2689575 RepID=UPI00135ACE39|nr:methyltransferase domain-containing protein [Paenibacillus sp. USDA918EY]